MSFIHLHVHSQYSFLDGASSLDSLLAKAKAWNMPALALTDHNRLTGAVRFYEKAKALAIKPIIGAEIFHRRFFDVLPFITKQRAARVLCHVGKLSVGQYLAQEQSCSLASR